MNWAIIKSVESFWRKNLKNHGIRDAYFLGKMVEVASFKTQRKQFHNKSTSFVDWDRHLLEIEVLLNNASLFGIIDGEGRIAGKR